VRIYVSDDDFAVASQLLLFDRVEAIFQPRPPRRQLAFGHPVWLVAFVLMLAAVSTVTRWF
jgi:hypothetical protein